VIITTHVRSNFPVKNSSYALRLTTDSMEEASAGGNSVGILVKRILGVADDVAMRFQVPISSRNKNSLSFLFHTLSTSLSTLCSELC